MSHSSAITSENCLDIFRKHIKSRAYTAFIESVLKERDHLKAAVFSFPVEAIDPLASLEILNTDSGFQYFWEKADTEFALAAAGCFTVLKAEGPGRFQHIEAQINEFTAHCVQFCPISHSYSGVHFLGGFSFFDSKPQQLWQGFEPASFTVPEWLIIKDGHLGIVTITIAVAKGDTRQSLHKKVLERLGLLNPLFELESTLLPKLDQPEALPSPQFDQAIYDHWVQSVDEAKSLIKHGAFEKIVLARKLSINLEQAISPTQMVNRLRRQYPDCYSFMIKNESSKIFLGSTPERLASFHATYLLTDALAGSIQRGHTATEDTILAKRLFNSKKDLEEHKFVVTAIRQKLRAVVREIEASNLPAVKKLSNVQHLFTPIRARLQKGIKPLSVLGRLHPTPAVGGYPWKKAAPYISKFEQFERGWYAGPVGWLNSNGRGEFAVAIRSALLSDDTIRLFAGCGIVSDSNAAEEWEETNLKLKPILSALSHD